LIRCRAPYGAKKLAKTELTAVLDMSEL